MKTQVKICGITNLSDALHSIECGADLLGFNFVEASSRYVAPGVARNIIEKIEGRVRTVGIFANQNIDRVFQITVDSLVDVVQFHGDEPASHLELIRDNLGLDVIKAFRMSADFNQSNLGEYAFAGILLDAYSPKIYGGTGELADWKKAKDIAAANKMVFLAGGLNPGNVADAVRFVRPYAVDVASGVESRQGKKDPKKVAAFIKAAKETI